MQLPLLNIRNPLLYPGEELEIDLLASAEARPGLVVREHYLEEPARLPPDRPLGASLDDPPHQGERLGLG